MSFWVGHGAAFLGGGTGMRSLHGYFGSVPVKEADRENEHINDARWIFCTAHGGLFCMFNKYRFILNGGI